MLFGKLALPVSCLLAAAQAAPSSRHVVVERQRAPVSRQQIVERQPAQARRHINDRQHIVTKRQRGVGERDRPTYLGGGIYTDPNGGNNNNFPFFPFPFFPPQNPAPQPCPQCPPQIPCPTCPPQPLPAVPCIANQSVVNPGFEANGGSFPPWTVSDPTAVVLDSFNGVQDPQGLHSAQFILSSTAPTAWIAQNVTVCPNKGYKVYFSVKLLQGPATSATATGSFADKSQCYIFVSLSGAGSSTITGASLQPLSASASTTNTITTANTFTTGNVTSSNIMISVVCATSAFYTTGGANVPGYMYFDNINLLPQN